MQNPKRSPCATITGSLLALTLGLSMSLAPLSGAWAAPTPGPPSTPATGSPTPTPSATGKTNPLESPASASDATQACPP